MDPLTDKPEAPDYGSLRSNTQEDLLAKGGKALLNLLSASAGFALAGPIGAIAGDLLVEIIPRQRQDRLQDFVEALAERLVGLEDEVRAKLESSAGYASLAEQAMFAAARTASRQKRRDLAELLRTGLSKDESELVQHEMLLRMRDPLNDHQALILYRYGAFRGTFGDPEMGAFLEKHPDVFVHEPSMGADAPTIRRWTMYKAYVGELVALGLLKAIEGPARKNQVGITELGRLLLEAIGCEVRR